MMRRLGRMAALVAVVCAVTASTASAAPRFSRPVPIGNGSAPAVAIAGDGSVFVAWVGPGGNTVYTARRGATDKKFTKQFDAGGNNVVPGSLAVVRASGTAAVAWTEDNAGATRVRVA